jgi:hypothetical protein
VSKYQKIRKPLLYRIQELIQSLQVMSDSLEAVKQGRLYQLIPLYGQLRALLSEKSKDNQPLLLTIAEEIGMQLNLYCMSDVNDKDFPSELIQNLVLHLSGFPVSIEQELPGQHIIKLEDFLNRKILFFKGREYREGKYSVEEIITFFANKAGGAHFSPDLPKDFAQLLSFELLGQPMLVQALIQIAEITYRLGLKLLRRLSEFEIHLLIFIPQQELSQAGYVFDNKYPNSPMRVFFCLNPGMRLNFGVTDIQRLTSTVAINRIIDWKKPHYFVLTLVINNRLQSKLEILMDGETLGEVIVPHPLFVINDPLNYMSYHNRSHDNDSAGLSIGFVEIKMLERSPLKKRIDLFLHFEELLARKDLECLYFEKGQYGYLPSGVKDMKDIQLINSPISWSLLKLMQGEYPSRESNSEKST